MEVLVTHDRATDGRPLIHVKFERLSSEADAPVVEVIYHVQWPQDFSIVSDNAVVLAFLSCTRTDTREAVELDPDEMKLTLENAVNYAAGLHEDW